MHPLGIASTLLLISTTLEIVDSQPYLTPASILVNENNLATLTCTYTGTKPVEVFAWRKDDKLEGDMIPPACTVFREPPDDTKYTYSCASNKQMTWTIRNSNRSNEGDNWTCSVYVGGASGYEDSNIVSIGVSGDGREDHAHRKKDKTLSSSRVHYPNSKTSIAKAVIKGP